jgi:hypothetical protein
MALGVLFGVNFCTLVHQDAGVICQSIKFEITDCHRDCAGNLVIHYVLRYQPPRSQSRLPDVLYYDEHNWTRDPCYRTVCVRSSANRRVVVPIDEPLAEPTLDGIQMNVRAMYKVLRAGESTAGYVRVQQEHFRKALTSLGVPNGSWIECMLSISVSGQARPPVVSEGAGTDARFYVQNASGRWIPFQLPEGAGDVLLHGTQNIRKQSGGESHGVTTTNTADEAAFAFQLSSSWVKDGRRSRSEATVPEGCTYTAPSIVLRKARILGRSLRRGSCCGGWRCCRIQRWRLTNH